VILHYAGYLQIYFVSCMKLRIGLKNLKSVFAIVFFNIHTATSDHLSFASVEIDTKIICWLWFVSQVVTWPVATRVFLQTTNDGRGERAWKRRCFCSRDIKVLKICKLARQWNHTLNQILIKYDKKRYHSQFV